MKAHQILLVVGLTLTMVGIVGMTVENALEDPLLGPSYDCEGKPLKGYYV